MKWEEVQTKLGHAVIKIISAEKNEGSPKCVSIKWRKLFTKIGKKSLLPVLCALVRHP